MAGEPVALEVPAAGAAERQHPGVLAGAVVLEPRRLRPALEVVLGRLGALEQHAHRGELFGQRQVRRRGDRELPRIEVVVRARERERLEGLRRRAEEALQPGIARGLDDPAVLHRNGVHPVRRLNDVAPPDDDTDGIHRWTLLAWR